MPGATITSSSVPGVKGGRFYGNFPLLAPGGGNDANTRGVLIPTTAVDQYGATLAQWFGVAVKQPAHSFPEYRELRDKSAWLPGLIRRGHSRRGL